MVFRGILNIKKNLFCFLKICMLRSLGVQVTMRVYNFSWSRSKIVIHWKSVMGKLNVATAVLSLTTSVLFLREYSDLFDSRV